MILTDAILAAILIALTSLVGALFFGNNQKLVGSQRYVIPIAVGVFLSLVLYELIPETLALAPEFGGLAVALGFISFYLLANILHRKYHAQEAENCDRKSASILLLIGDTIHNFADGIILGGAFLISPEIGIATAIGLALHEVPQEIVEFGVLVRGGFSRSKAALLNLLSAGSIVLGTIAIILIAEHATEYIWLFTGFAAGNLLFLAASDLLPRIHGSLNHYGNIWKATFFITIGFVVMTSVIHFSHEKFGHEHDEEEHSYTEHTDEEVY